MNKKIAIVGHYKDFNFGTMLQAYALSYTISKMGIDNEYINYELYPDNITKFGKLLFYLKTSPQHIIKMLFKKKHQKYLSDYFESTEFSKSKILYNDFFKRIPQSKVYTYTTIKSVENDYDNFIVGSDQTWSSGMYTNYSINFLPFVHDREKKNSYSPSLGSNRINKKFANVLKSGLSNFNYISCRDNFGVNYLKELIGRDIIKTLDPTLLLTRDEWRNLENSISIPHDYILVYQLGTRVDLSIFAETIANKKNTPIYYIATNKYTYYKSNVFKNVGPSEFLFLIRNASCVITDSYHGTLFSLNFEKEFYSFSKYKASLNCYDNARILDFLKDFNLENVYIQDVNKTFLPSIDYNWVIERLNIQRQISLDYLKKIVGLKS